MDDMERDNLALDKFVELFNECIEKKKKSQKDYKDYKDDDTVAYSIISVYESFVGKKINQLKEMKDYYNVLNEEGNIKEEKLYDSIGRPKSEFKKVIDLLEEEKDLEEKLKKPDINREEAEKINERIDNIKEEIGYELRKVDYALSKIDEFITILEKEKEDPEAALNKEFTYGPAPSGTSPVGPAPSGTSPVGPAPSGTSPVGPAPSGTSPVGPAPSGTSSDDSEDFNITEEDQKINDKIANIKVRNVNGKAIRRLGTAIKIGFTIAGIALPFVLGGVAGAIPIIIAAGVAYAPTVTLMGVVGFASGGVLGAFLARKGFRLSKEFVAINTTDERLAEIRSKRINKYRIKSTKDLKKVIEQVLSTMKKDDVDSVTDSITKLLELREKCRARIKRLEDRIEEINAKYSMNLDKWELDIEAKKTAINELKEMIKAIDKGLKYLGYDEPELGGPGSEGPSEGDGSGEGSDSSEESGEDEPEIPTDEELYNNWKKIIEGKETAGKTEEEINDELKRLYEDCEKNIEDGNDVEFNTNLKEALGRILEERGIVLGGPKL